jgi:hypothetical protein
MFNQKFNATSDCLWSVSSSQCYLCVIAVFLQQEMERATNAKSVSFSFVNINYNAKAASKHTRALIGQSVSWTIYKAAMAMANTPAAMAGTPVAAAMPPTVTVETLLLSSSLLLVLPPAVGAGEAPELVGVTGTEVGDTTTTELVEQLLSNPFVSNLYAVGDREHAHYHHHRHRRSSR